MGWAGAGSPSGALRVLTLSMVLPGVFVPVLDPQVQERCKKLVWLKDSKMAGPRRRG